jgi:hypothetical protein
MLPPRNPEPDPEMLALQRRFRAIGERHDRRKRTEALLKRARRWGFTSGLFALGALNVYLALLNFSPWPPLVTLRHLAAFPNCNSAQVVGLAPAKRGEPGYWESNDDDNDGIACEPWSGQESGGERLYLPRGRFARPPL